ncbi:hypothetical protein EDB81DRAFT_783734 [Dactylonectria macrodidyma]|uniref:Uncharacterized protein n=1 Tax=Dactylonectria macrodidyma TaxID=307937 RepID=A0A9P9FGD1_9HYPO|nr:hypothetical protein EDB81DRAFT_783734 [Dactylonectria macrodidyma]
MYDSQMSSRAGIVSPFYEPIESSPPSAGPAKIIVTPPTPIDDHVGITGDDEDTHKEVIQLHNITEEKEVYDYREVLEEKQVYVDDSKEAICHPASMGVNSQHIDEAEEKIHHPEAWLISAEKEVLGQQNCHIQPMESGKVEKEAYDPDEAKSQQHDPNQPYDELQLGAMNSGHLVETTDSEAKTAKTQSSVVQRHFNAMSQAVDKRKKALTTFTTQSNTRLREGYAQIEQNVTDRSVAMEQGANVRWKRLGQGFSERVQRVEKGTSKRFNRLEKGFNDQVNRAEKSVDDRVASLKQNIGSVKGLGSTNTKGQLQ